VMLTFLKKMGNTKAVMDAKFKSGTYLLKRVFLFEQFSALSVPNFPKNSEKGEKCPKKFSRGVKERKISYWV
jgi:hypothetical protein